MSTKPPQVQIASELARVAAVDASRLLPLIVVLAVATAVPRLERRALLWGSLVVAALGFFSARVPAFSVVPVPGFVATWLAAAGHAVSHWLGFVAVLVIPAIAVVCIIVAAVRMTRLGSAGQRGAGLSLARLPAGARHLATGLTVFVILQATLWTAVVMRMTLSGTVLPGAVTGAVAANYLSGLLLACAAVAVLAAALRPAGARLVMWAGVAAVALAGAWYATNGVVMKIWHPVAAAEMAHMAAFWGSGAFWAAIFVAVPLALAGLSILP
jgi:hypothetical protein